MSSSTPASSATGSRSRPSRSAARATASASIRSDLPRARPLRRSPAISRVATLTTRSPWTNRNRSKEPETWRQSSSAHTHNPTLPHPRPPTHGPQHPTPPHPTPPDPPPPPPPPPRPPPPPPPHPPPPPPPPPPPTPAPTLPALLNMSATYPPPSYVY